MELPSLPPCWFLFRKAANNPYSSLICQLLGSWASFKFCPWFRLVQEAATCHLAKSCSLLVCLDEKSVSAWISLVLSWQLSLTSAALWHRLFLLPNRCLLFYILNPEPHKTDGDMAPSATAVCCWAERRKERKAADPTARCVRSLPTPVGLARAGSRSLA